MAKVIIAFVVGWVSCAYYCHQHNAHFPTRQQAKEVAREALEKV